MSHTQCACLRKYAMHGPQQFQIYVSTDDRWFAKHKGFQNLKYCIWSKGFLEHLEVFLYPQFMKFRCSVCCQATDANGVR